MNTNLTKDTLLKKCQRIMLMNDEVWTAYRRNRPFPGVLDDAARELYIRGIQDDWIRMAMTIISVVGFYPTSLNELEISDQQIKDILQRIRLVSLYPRLRALDFYSDGISAEMLTRFQTATF